MVAELSQRAVSERVVTKAHKRAIKRLRKGARSGEAILEDAIANFDDVYRCHRINVRGEF